MKKKIICLLITLTVAVSVCCALALSAEAADWETSGDLKFRLNIDGSAYTVAAANYRIATADIPSTFKGKPVTSIGEDVFSGCSGLTSVTIPNSVTSIGSYAFWNCSGLTSVEIPNSVTSIGGWAFDGCSGLTSVTIGNSVTSIGYGAFYNTGYYNNTSNWTNGVLYIGNYLIVAKNTVSGNYSIKDGTKCIADSAFRGCSKLTSVSIPNSVTSIGEDAFSGCRKLTSVTIGNSVTSIGEDAFSGCSGLTSVKIPNSVTSIGEDAFYKCSGLTSVTIPNSVTSIGEDAFYGCSGLTSVNITDIAKWCGIEFGSYDANPLYYAHNLYLNGELVTGLVIPDGVTSIGSYAFKNCSGLTSVSIPNSVTSIGSYAFWNCSGLTSVKIPNSVTSIGKNAFVDCSGLTELSVDEGNAVYHSSGNCIIETASNALIVGCMESVIPTDGSVTNIGTLAFSGCTGLTSVSIPNSVTSIGSGAFENCSKLTSVTIPNSVTSIKNGAFYNTGYYNNTSNWTNGVLYIGNYLIVAKNTVSGNYSIKDGTKCIADSAFRGCSKLTSAEIPNSVTSIGDYAFYYCTGLTSVEIPNSVTSIKNGAFGGCSGLTSVTIGNSVTSIGGWAFDGCSGLTSVTIGNGVTSIGEEAFSNCSGLTSVTIGNGVTSIGEEAFSNCSGLTSVYITDIAKWCEIKVNNYFANPLYYAHNLYLNGELVTDLVIPDGVTSIGNYAFYECRGLTSVYIPNSMTSIGSGAFNYCSGLTSVHITDIAKWCGIKFNDSGANPLSYANNLYLNGELVTDLVIPDGVTSIADRAFWYCSRLTSVTIPNSVTNIGHSAFRSCSGLTSVTIGNGVTSIGSGAFENCYGLTSVTIPNSVTSIGDSAFENCNNLETIYFNGSEAKWNSISKGSDWDYNAGKGTASKYTLVFLYTGYTVSGTATSFGSQTDNVTIQLIKSGTSEAAYEAVVQGNKSNYSIENVESGTYTLRVSKKNHVTREYTVTIGDDNFTQDVIIYLAGDVNGDGKINGTDYLRIRGAFLKTYTLSDEFLKVADVNGDGRINGTDYLRVRGHYLGTYNLYK